MSQSTIKNIVILGADTLGWTAAVGLARGLQGQANIIVVPTNSQPEPAFYYANPAIFDYHRTLGINEEHLIKNQTLLLQSGIQLADADLINMQMLGTNGFLPVFKGLELHQLSKYLNQEGISPYSYAAQAAIANKRIERGGIAGSLQASCNPGCQVNSHNYQQFMQGAAMKSGVHLAPGTFSQLVVSPQNGFISQIVLQNGMKIPVDLIIDNSGNPGLAMHVALGATYLADQNSSSFNTLIEVQCHSQTTAKPYTKLQASELGIISQLNSYDRVYYQLYCRKNPATEFDYQSKLLSSLGCQNEVLSSQEIRLVAGQSSQFFYKNCVAIGLTAGTIPSPLISPLVLTQRAISRLLDLFPGINCSEANANEFNRLTARDYCEAWDYHQLIQHTMAINFASLINSWAVSSESMSAALRQKLALFKAYGRFEDQLNQMVTRQDWLEWLSIIYQQEDNLDPLLSMLSKTEVEQFLTKLKQDLYTQIVQLPDYHQSQNA